MKNKLAPYALACIMAGIITLPNLTHAATKNNQELAAMVADLQAEVNSLKQELHGEHSGKRRPVKRRVKAVRPVSAAPTTLHTDEPHPTSTAVITNAYDSAGGPITAPFDTAVPGEALVSTGPYQGVNIEYSGANLIITSPGINTDSQLLSIRKKISQALAKRYGVRYDHSHLLFSGIIESQAIFISPSQGSDTSDIDVTNISLDATIFGPTDWLLGFIEFSHDGRTPAGTSFVSNSNYRFANSRIYLNKAFVTIGNFEKSPIFATIGQFFVPFGAYSSVMVNDPLPKLLARTKARAIQIGYHNRMGKNLLYGAAYIFRGDSHTSAASRINNGGLDLGYKFDAGEISGSVGASLIANLADSAGMQIGAGLQNAEKIHHAVPAYDLRGTLSVGKYVDFIGEFVSALRTFDGNDLIFNRHSAQPWAYNFEVSRSFTILNDKPSSIGLGYGQTGQALGLGLPESTVAFVFNTSLMRNTLESLELRHNTYYRNHDCGSQTECFGNQPINRVRSDNSITAQLDFYF